MIRVFLVEDSSVQREFLRFLLEQHGEFSVIGIAHDGGACVQEIERLRPDIVLMDYHMPRIGGLEATRRIMEQCPTPIVIASASLVPEDVGSSFEAVRYGALALIEKPPAMGSPHHERLARDLLRTLRLMAAVKVVRRRAPRGTPQLGQGKPNSEDTVRARIVALAGSTGAPAVIADILEPLRKDLPVPICIVQHLSEGFIVGFARWLDAKTELPVTVARHGGMALPGHVYLAPDGAQMAISGSGCIALADAPTEEGFRPSATYLFRSVAKAFGKSALGILLSGMGKDGASGLDAVFRAGGVTAVQDAASCVVFGMPREAIRLGAATHILPPREIARLINSCQSVVVERENVRSSLAGLV